MGFYLLPRFNFGNKSSKNKGNARQKLEASMKFSTLHDGIKSELESCVRFKFDIEQKIHEVDTPTEIKQVYELLHTKIQHLDVKIKEFSPKIAELHTLLRTMNSDSRALTIFSKKVQRIQENFNTLNTFYVDLSKEYDYFYEDHQGILVH